jgi:uncharacterized repeat protein (TIGR03806 family)
MNLLRRPCVAALVLGLALTATARAADHEPPRFDPAAPPAKQISEYRFFLDGAKQIPNTGVIPYEINSALFSDYTEKHRFIYVPAGNSAAYDDRDVFSFPVGSVIIKTFGYLHDIRDPSKGERILETRLLAHTNDGWVGLPYVWNADATDATLRVAGTTVDVEWIHYNGSRRTNNYIIPNMNQCKGCHEQAGKLQPLGPKARNLNREFDYGAGPVNQLTHLTRSGVLTGAPADPADAPRLAEWTDPATGGVAERARAYLENNCMHCHNPHGPGNTSGLDLTFDQSDPLKYGVLKPPVAAGRGAGHALFDIVPGKPDDSILYIRLASTDPGVMMPELPRRLVDEEGLALVREWILQMEPDTVSAGQD